MKNRHKICTELLFLSLFADFIQKEKKHMSKKYKWRKCEVKSKISIMSRHLLLSDEIHIFLRTLIMEKPDNFSPVGNLSEHIAQQIINNSMGTSMSFSMPRLFNLYSMVFESAF